MRDFVDEEDYPPSQEYFLYADSQVDFRKLKIKNKYCFFCTVSYIWVASLILWAEWICYKCLMACFSNQKAI
jgi:hypothetical protein